MDSAKLSAVAHATHQFQSPISVEMLDRTLAFAGLTPGARVFDLGCGHAGVALHLAEHYGARVEAVERSPLMAEQAGARIAGHAGPGSVTLHVQSAQDFLAGAAPCDLLVAIGAVHLAGEAGAADTLKALSAHIRPGGALLWGESYWITPPAPVLKGMLGPTADLYLSHADSVGAGEKAGLTPLYAAAASVSDWDEYAWRYTTAVEDYAAANPDDPDTPAMRTRVRAWRALYLHQSRGVMGFGLYLFRSPD